MIYHRTGGERYILFIEYQLKASPDRKKGKGEGFRKLVIPRVR